jgi:hypothetical protein
MQFKFQLGHIGLVLSFGYEMCFQQYFSTALALYSLLGFFLFRCNFCSVNWKVFACWIYFGILFICSSQFFPVFVNVFFLVQSLTWWNSSCIVWMLGYLFVHLSFFLSLSIFFCCLDAISVLSIDSLMLEYFTCVRMLSQLAHYVC